MNNLHLTANTAGSQNGAAVSPPLPGHIAMEYATMDYLLLPKKRLIVMSIAGELRFRTLKRFLGHIIEQPDHSPDMKGVVDMRKAHFLLSPEEVEEFADLAAEIGYSSERWAYISDSPMGTALSILYRERIADTHEGEVFSTPLGAAEYLCMDLHEYLPD